MSKISVPMMSWVGCLRKDSELFTLFTENSQIILRISDIPILLTFMYLIALESVGKTNSTHRPTQLFIAAHNCHTCLKSNTKETFIPKFSVVFHQQLTQVDIIWQMFWQDLFYWKAFTVEYLKSFYLWTVSAWTAINLWEITGVLNHPNILSFSHIFLFFKWCV